MDPVLKGTVKVFTNLFFQSLISSFCFSYKIKYAVQMALLNEFPDGRYPTANPVMGFGPAIRKVLDHKRIRGQLEGIREELAGKNSKLLV